MPNQRGNSENREQTSGPNPDEQGQFAGREENENMDENIPNLSNSGGNVSRGSSGRGSEEGRRRGGENSARIQDRDAQGQFAGRSAQAGTNSGKIGNPNQTNPNSGNPHEPQP